jgi:hypothetical protein
MRSRHQPHQAWWQTVLEDPDFRALSELRNEEVKGWNRLTAEHVVTSAGLEVLEVSLLASDEWGRSETFDGMYVASLAPEDRVRHEFVAPPWAGTPVLPRIKDLLDRLEFEVMPVAAQFSARWGPEGKPLPEFGPSDSVELPAFLHDAWCLVLEPEESGQTRWVYTLTKHGG